MCIRDSRTSGPGDGPGGARGTGGVRRPREPPADGGGVGRTGPHRGRCVVDAHPHGLDQGARRAAGGHRTARRPAPLLGGRAAVGRAGLARPVGAGRCRGQRRPRRGRLEHAGARRRPGRAALPDHESPLGWRQGREVPPGGAGQGPGRRGRRTGSGPAPGRGRAGAAGRRGRGRSAGSRRRRRDAGPGRRRGRGARHSVHGDQRRHAQPLRHGSGSGPAGSLPVSGGPDRRSRTARRPRLHP